MKFQGGIERKKFETIPKAKYLFKDQKVKVFIYLVSLLFEHHD